MNERTNKDKASFFEYEVFPGISLVYCASHTQYAQLRETVSKSVFEIFHCREGRMECNIGNDYCYISQGDILIAGSHRISSSVHFPLCHYHGIVIRIDTFLAPKCLSCFLRDVAVQPIAIADKFCGENDYFIARSNSSFEHIFSELYNVPEEIRQGYSKIKILELMLFLSVFDEKSGEAADRTLSESQVSLAKEVAVYLTDNMDEKITLEMAAKRFHVSVTNLKNSFKSVYGVPFYAYIKARKMESAAYMLEYTEKSVIEIANEHGYDNSSKFASAFRSVKGMAPGEYRALNKK